MSNGNTTPTKKHFVDYNNATAVLTPYANEIRKQQPIPITYANYQLLSEADKNTHRYVITDYPSTGIVNNMSLDSLTDVDTSGAATGKVLGYSETDSEWKPITVALEQKQTDWNQSDNTKEDYIKNKPTLGTAAALNVATSGDAGTTEVVKGNDSRLTDARTPVSHTHTLSQITDAGTAAAKGSTSSVISGSSDLVESGAVYTAINNAIASAYKAGGTKTCAELVSSLLIAGNVGTVYNITDNGTTTSDFVEGSGKPIKIGDDVGIIDIGSTSTHTYKFNLMASFVDLSNYPQKSSTAGLMKNDGSIDTTTYVATNDGRLSDARPASDVYSWAKAATKPSYSASEVGAVPGGGATFISGNGYNAEHDCNNINYNGVFYYNGNGPSTELGASTNDGGLYSQFHSEIWGGQIAQDYRNGNMFVRGRNNGTFTEWHRVITGNDIGYGRFSTTDWTSYIKIAINSPAYWMLSFVVTLYQGYRGTKIMVSGFHYGENYWYSPSAVLLGDTGNDTMPVYFGYDSVWDLWVAFPGGGYTGVCVSDVTNGYDQIDLSNLFTITAPSSLGTVQHTVNPIKPDAATVNGISFALVN